MMMSLRSRFRAATKSLMADHSSTQSSQPPTQKKKNNNNCTKPVPSSSSLLDSPRFIAFSFNKCLPDPDHVTSTTSILDTVKPFPVLKNPFWCESGKSKSPKHPPDSRGIGVVLSDGTTTKVLFGTNVRVKIPVLLDSRCDFGTKSKSSSSPSAVPTGPMIADRLCPDEMELSEDYTRVVYHGPNPKTTHIYGNCIVDDFCSWSSPMENKPPLIPSPKSFLSCCYTCRKDLGQDNDIYMYRGEKAFCSRECRYQEMLLDGEEEG